MKYLICFMLLASTAHAATITSASTSRADVATALTLCAAGDTLSIPAGTSDWTTKITFNLANLIVQGAGTNSTVITDGVTADTGVVSLSADNIRLTGIRFSVGSRATKYFNGVVQVSGGKLNTRIDHCHFDALKNKGILWRGNEGVIDHCTFDSVGSQPIQVVHTDWNRDGVGDYGDAAWADDYVWGSQYACFIEDNLFTQVNGSVYGLDSDTGSKVVFRFNTIDTHLTLHGTESSNPYRGAQAWEIYNNTFTGNSVSGGQNIVDVRSGSVLVYSNSFVSVTQYPRIVQCYDYRLTGTWGVFGGANGTNNYDVNVGAVFESGTATSGGASLAMNDTSKSWTVNQWVDPGFAFVLWNHNPNTGEKKQSIITGNTATQLQFSARSNEGGSNMNFESGDTYEIRKVSITLDQPAYIGGDLLNRATPAWPNQTLAPIYVWENTYGDATVIDINVHASPGVYKNIVRGTHILFSSRPGYTPYAYPHPLQSGGAGPPPVPPPDAPGPGRSRRRVVIFDQNLQPHSQMMELTNLMARLDTTNATETILIPSEQIASRLVDFTQLGGTNRGFFVWWKGE